MVSTKAEAARFLIDLNVSHADLSVEVLKSVRNRTDFLASINNFNNKLNIINYF